MSIDLLSLSASKLQKVISLKRKIERLNGQLEKIGGGPSPVKQSGEAPTRKRRNMSPEARQRIAAAAKARWAKYRANQK